MLKVVICEDEPAYLSHLSGMVRELFDSREFAGEVLFACGTQEELERYIEAGDANVYLLDINLKNGLEGYETALKIKERQPGAYIVFISENLGLVFQSFKARPFDFLPKPVTRNVLANLLTDIERHMSAFLRESEAAYLTVRSAATDYRLKKDDIIMIEKYKEKAYIYTTGSKITCNTNLEDFESMLSDVKSIVRCHKSYIVNKNYIVEKNSVEMKLLLEGGLVCYVSRNYRKRVF